MKENNRVSQNERKAKQRENQRAWLEQHARGLTAEAVIQAAIRGECKITFISGTPAATARKAETR